MNATEHVEALRVALATLDYAPIERIGAELACLLDRNGRVLIAGNGGSAAHAQHLAAELVGRYRDERRPFSVIALHAETSSVTAIANDYGWDEVFARQVRAHGRPGDALLAISTSGASANLLAAAGAAAACGVQVWALTGRAPNPLAGAADMAVCVDALTTATVQEVHQVLVHLLCEIVDRSVRVGSEP
jgi:D-sedoheptulose 7-phosphate isomerase